MKDKNLLRHAIIIVLLSKSLWAEEQTQAAEEATPQEAVILSPAVKMMQEIEPGFMPKDSRVVDLFLLQKAVGEAEDNIKKKNESIGSARALFIQKFRQDLTSFVGGKFADKEARLSVLTDEAIKYYEEALKNNPYNSLYAADALYNLGRFYFDRDEKDYFLKLADYNTAREQGRDDVAYPDEDFHRTIDTYETLIQQYPQFPALDSAYYLLGLALWYEGAFNQAVKTFHELIAKYPSSRYVEEVWFRLGEFFYDMEDYDDAVKSYEHVISNPQSKLYDKALYKIAWSHYQKDRFMKAVDYFTKVLALTFAETEEKTQVGMRAEVTRYIVKSFSEVLLLDEGRPKTKINTKPKISKEQKKPKLTDREEKLGLKLVSRIVQHFAQQNNPPYLKDILIEAASQLVEESKIDGAVSAFEQVIKLDPKSPDNPKYESQIVDILQEADRQEDARERNQAIIKQYGKDSAWYKAQNNNYQSLLVAREAVRDALLALAVHYHKTGKDQKNAKDEKNASENFKKAARLYALYVRDYPEREDTHKAIFYFAEAAFETNRFRTALDAYQLLKDYPLPLPDNIRRDATLNIVFTFRHVLESEAKEQRFKEIDFDHLTSKLRGSSPEEIPDLGKKYLAAIDEFLKLQPNDEQVPVLLFHAAAIYYVYGHQEEALSRLHYIIDTYPKTLAAPVAARLIIDDAVAKEQWTYVVELSKRFAAMNLGEQKGDFAKIEGTARFKIARAIFEEANELHKNNQLAEAKAKYKESAEQFLKLLDEDPKNPYADVMLFNSARAVVLSGTMTMALPLYKRLYKDYPTSEYAKTARFQEALALEKMLKFGEAAKAYDGIIKEDPKAQSAGDAMLNKALLYEAASEPAQAATAFIDFAKQYPEREEAADALLSAASIYKKLGKTSQQIAMLEQFIKQYSKDKNKTPNIIEAHVQIADTYGELAKSAQAAAVEKRYQKNRQDNLQKAIALYNSDLGSPIAAYYAAKAQLIVQKPEQDSFKKMTINARTGKAQAEQLTAMMKRLTELSAQNEAIIKAYAQPVWNAESLRRIGALYEHLAKTMLKAPCPKDVANIDEFACDEYTVLLEDKAAVLEEKALSGYKQAYEIAISAYDASPELITDILAGLNRMKPGEYQRVGNLIEKPKTGTVYGVGRMLSTGRMASTLHEKEVDPDKKPVLLPEPEQQAPASREEQPQEQTEPKEEMIEDLEEGLE